jgi:hypothetical protein
MTDGVVGGRQRERERERKKEKLLTAILIRFRGAPGLAKC